MDKTKALKKLLNGTATKKEIELLQQVLARGEISIGGDVRQSIVITGDGNTINLTPEALRLLNPDYAERAETEEPAEGEPPYMGLRYFDTADAALFYGREGLTNQLIARLSQESLLAIVGASGSGKSSVARAGLIPAWQKGIDVPGGCLSGAVHILTPGARPLESLAASLTRGSESVTATATLIEDLQRDARNLRLYLRKSLSVSGGTHLLLLVDQFEEAFTLCKDTAERKTFIENLLEAANEEAGPLRLVLTLRADFYHRCGEYEGLRQALQVHQAYIGAMNPDELRQAVTAPAEAAGWDFEPGLVDLILSEVGAEPGALPLLSHALLETWKRRQGRTLTLKGYADAGGVKRAIARTAESVYDRLSPDEQTIARGIFVRLTELGEGMQDTRRRAGLDELLGPAGTQDSVGKVLKTLTDARLVTTGQACAEVAHEALIREWPALRRWLDEDRESLLVHRHLAGSAREWERRGRETGELYRGARLTQIQEWVKTRRNLLNPLEGEFLQASLAELQRERLAKRLRWAAFAGAGLLVLLTIVLALTGRLNNLIYRPLDMRDYWVSIPAGEFLMGSETGKEDERPVHAVILDAFEIGRYEVTNRQYNQCLRAGICVGDIVSGLDLHPVVSISSYDAQTFCKWIGGRLPTEAEWEKAARGGLEGQEYPWGDESPVCTPGADNGASFDAQGCQFSTMPVGSFAPNGYGLFDMAGNVWEWVGDWYAGTYYAQSPAENPAGPEGGGIRVLRGGSWNSTFEYLRLAARNRNFPEMVMYNFGFRCVRETSP